MTAAEIDLTTVPHHADPTMRWALVWIDPADDQRHHTHTTVADRDAVKGRLERDGLTVYLVPQVPPTREFRPPVQRYRTSGPNREVHP